MMSPALVVAPGPTARTSPSLFFEIELSGRRIPLAVFVTGATLRISTRSARGISFFNPLISSQNTREVPLSTGCAKIDLLKSFAAHIER